MDGSNLKTPRTPMSERQQLALLRQQQILDSPPNDCSSLLSSPPRTPLQVVNGLNNSASKYNPSTPRTPAEDKLLRKLHKKNAKGETPLHVAAIRGNTRLVKKLLQLGALPNVKDNAGWSPLHEACNRGNIYVVRILVEYGADLNSLGDGRETPLHDAARNGHYKVVKFLAKSGANLAARNISGKTPFEVAANPDNKCRNPRLEETIRFLKNYGENLNNESENENEDAADDEDDEDDRATYSESDDDEDDDNEADNDVVRFLGLSHSPGCGDYLFQTLHERPSPLISKRDMKKALVNKSNNSAEKNSGQAPRLTVRLQQLNSESTIKTRLTYGMEENTSNTTLSTTTSTTTTTATNVTITPSSSASASSNINTNSTNGTNKMTVTTSATTAPVTTGTLVSSTVASTATVTSLPSSSSTVLTSSPTTTPTVASSVSTTVVTSSKTAKDDVYEFKSSSKEATPVSSRSSQSPEPTTANNTSISMKTEPMMGEAGDSKRAVDNTEDEDSKRKKVKKEEIQSKSGRGSRGSSMEKVTKGRPVEATSQRKSSPTLTAQSPKKTESDSDDENSKKSTDSSGLKVPPLKIVLSSNNNNNGGNASPPNNAAESNVDTNSVQTQEKKAAGNNNRYVVNKDEVPIKEEVKSEDVSESESGSNEKSSLRMTRSKTHQSTPGPEGLSDSNTSSEQTSSSSEPLDKDQKNLNNSSSLDYSFKKRKLRSQVDESGNTGIQSGATRGGGGGGGAAAGSGAGTGSGGNTGGNLSGNLGSGNGSSGNTANNASGTTNNSAGNVNVPATGTSVVEPLNDIEKYLNIRKQIEQRRKNLFPVQPKPPQGFKDYLMNRKTYLLQENANERLRQIPLIQPPPSLDGAMSELFKEQEEARYKLRMKHVVEKEKLVLSVEQEILRVHGRAARALANQSLPYSLCTILRDEEIYTPIDPQQEEKNRDIRSRYNGRLFLSWLQDVDDKWERIKEQMVLRHHNEAESLNAVQKMDWEWKLKEISDNPSSFNDSIKPQIDDLLIPMVHVSDDFDLSDCRN